MSKVRRNTGAQVALGELNKNNDRLRRALQKISRGQKINSAQDSSSAYVISEKMREQIRTLAQDNQNVQNGATLLKIADGGINSIVEELRSLKELAINAVNDTNTDQDRATLQKVFSQKMANINDIAATTNYNGKILLDGSFAKGKEFEVEHTTIEWIDNEPTKISSGNYTISNDGYYILESGYTGIVTVNAKNVRLTQEDPTTALNNTNIRCQGGDKNFWIKDLNIAAAGGGNSIRFEGNNAKNYLVVEGSNTIAGGVEAENNGTLNILGDGSLNTASEDIIGASDLIIGDNVTINCRNINGVYGDIKIGGNANITSSSIRYGSLNNTDRDIIIGGNAKVTATAASTLGIGSFGNNTSMGDIIIGGNSVVNVTNITNPTGIGIGGRNGSCGDIKIGGHAVINTIGSIGSCGSTCGDIIIGNNAKVTNTSSNMNWAGIGCAMNDTCGDIKIGNNATVIVNNTSSSIHIAAIGSGQGGQAGDITISGNANVTTNYTTTSGNVYAAGIGGGGTGSTVGNISIGGNATVTTKSVQGAGIGSGQHATAGNIIIGDSANVTASSGNGAGIGSGGNSNNTIPAVVGNITISNSATVTATSSSGQNIGAGYNSTAGTVTYSNNVHVADISLSLATVVIPDTPDKPGATKNYITTTETLRGEDSPLKIHHGTKANQATNFYIEDMHTKSLGTGKLINGDGTFINDSDREKYIALGLASDSSYQTDKQAEWLATVTAAQNKTLDDISVTTKHNANISIRVLDGAIDYALDQATQIGSYLQRLEYTDANITTMGENVQSAESTIRDADMAKEMTEYTKWNVLTQSAQAMLAQANQNGSAVLSLLQ